MTKTFGQRLAATQRSGTYKKTDNADDATEIKVAIRGYVLDCIGAENASVFDAFAGSGHMYYRVWKRAARYVGCDERMFWDHRPTYVADNRRVMRAIDLTDFNVFDFDSYGSPWEQALILCDRRPLRDAERIGVVLTDGCGLRLKMAHIPNGLAKITGMRRKMLGAGRMHDGLIDRAIDAMCAKLGASVVRRWQGKGKSGAAVLYIGLVLEAK